MYYICCHFSQQFRFVAEFFGRFSVGLVCIKFFGLHICCCFFFWGMAVWSCVILVICFRQTPSGLSQLSLCAIPHSFHRRRPICTEVHSNVNELHWPQNKAGNSRKNMRRSGEREFAGSERKKGEKA